MVMVRRGLNLTDLSWLPSRRERETEEPTHWSGSYVVVTHSWGGRTRTCLILINSQAIRRKPSLILDHSCPFSL